MARRKAEGIPLGASESATESPKKTTGTNSRASAKKPTESPQRATQKTQKKVFSFRAPAELADSWRVWADARGLKVDELGEKAISEYIKRHKLSEDQQTIYDIKMAQKGERS